MTEEEYFLACISEECAEVAQRAMKCLRFGLKEIQPGQTLTNAERLVSELIDLQATVEMAQDLEIIKEPIDKDLKLMQKAAKIIRYMNYSKELGILK